MKNNKFLNLLCIGSFMMPMLVLDIGVFSLSVAQSTGLSNEDKVGHVPDSSSHVFCLKVKWEKRVSNPDGKTTKGMHSSCSIVSYHYSRNVYKEEIDDGRPKDEPKLDTDTD